MFQVGERIGDYEILQVLGAGGMGQVYKVRNTLSDRVEAMKVLLPGLVGDADLADRFLREIKVQASLIHKNIAQLYTAQRNGEQILMLLEFVDGVTLESLMKRGVLSTEATVSIFSQVLDALSFAHAHGVVHRDIKPANIMVTRDGTAKLMDFGIARGAADRKLTQTGRTVGSLYYMSPEQIRGTDDIDGRTDLYSLGVSLYEAATGSRPFEGDSDYTIMAAHLQQPPVPPADRDPRLNKTLSDVILAAIEKDRNQRFQSADAFRKALNQVGVAGASAAAAAATLIGQPPPNPPHPMPTRTMGNGVGSPAAPPPPPVTAPPVYMAPPPPVAAVMPRKSNAVMFMALGALAFAGIAGFGVWQFSGGHSGSNAQQGETKVAIDKKQPSTDTQTPQQQQPQKQPVETSTTAPQQTSTEPAKPNVTAPTTTRPGKIEVAQQQQQRPSIEQPPPQPQPVSTNTPQPIRQDPPPAPAIDPAVAREMESLRQHYNQLAIRMAGVKEGMASLEAQQQRMGLGLRGDVKEAARNADNKMREAMNALKNKDVETARADLEAAERMIEFAGKAVGR